MHNISNLSYFGTTLYMFRTVSSSIIRSLRLYIQHQVYVIQVLWLLANGKEMEQSSISFPFPFQNKINLRYCASGWFYYKIYYDSRSYKRQMCRWVFPSVSKDASTFISEVKESNNSSLLDPWQEGTM